MPLGMPIIATSIGVLALEWSLLKLKGQPRSTRSASPTHQHGSDTASQQCEGNEKAQKTQVF
jgi:hypothetical protein